MINKRIVALPLLNGVEPFIFTLFADFFNQDLKYSLHIAYNRYISDAILPDFGWVDVDMNNLGIRSKSLQITRYTIVKASTACNEQIAFVYSPICIHRAVHAEHAEREWMVDWENTQAHQRHRCWQIGLFGKLPHFVLRPGCDRTTTNIKHRPLGTCNHFSRLKYLANVPLVRRLITRHFRLFRVFEINFGDRHVPWQVNQHRSRPSRSRNVKC